MPVEQSRLALCVLLGENPSYFGDETFDDALLDNYQVMDIPVGLPSELLERRPDIMEASFNMDEAAANVGLAVASVFRRLRCTEPGYRFQFDRRYFRRSFVGVVGRRVARAADL